ncbi:FAD-dependent oxidoreductase [Irregularibacter muris]|uniref:FAD-dependent oxidoreductase n=1 Tax=Irregularibacter muris TaxID=1796619 RepID=A0AAE3HGB6_9FIRM|nr:FAD-dependent oxidoreductase [Irregularibacter muris]MCR1900072.1 FAD-dependent oxidoreductase [Irregularibacter muris]
MKFEKLLEPGKIGNLELKNRMIMPGMGTNLAAADGTVSDVIVNYYARRANGGVGLIITEVCCPDPLGRVIPGEIEITKVGFMPGLSRIPHAAHSGGAKVCLQLAHGGCFASEGVTGEQPISPSGVGTFQLPDDTPREMTIEEIKELIEKYAMAAQRARQCGFDAVELHGAHGYMPLQFLSAYTNRRTDEYGGSLENRARFALETIRAMKKHAGEDFPLIYRLSADEDVPNGITLEEACTFAKWAEEAGADAIHVSAGTWDSRLHKYNAVMAGEESAEGKNLSQGVATSMWVPPNYTPRGSLKHLAAAVKKYVKVPVITVGSIPPEMAEEILEKNEADFVSIGRQTIADPDYANKIAEGEAETIRRCLRCNECLGEVMAFRGISCAVNAEAGKEFEGFVQVSPTQRKKKVAIVGSGPAGMQATLTAMERGHDVTLFEKDDRLGGALYYVGLPDFKIDYRDYTKYLIHAVENSGAKIKTGTEVTAQMIKKGNFDTVIVATGAVTYKPGIKGAEDTTIVDPLKVLDGNIPEGKDIIVCGAGLIGCEVAMFLAELGKNVTMIDKLPEPAMDLAIYTKWVLNSKLAELGVKVRVDHKIDEMTGKYVKCTVDNQEVEYKGDAVVCALGLKAERKLLEDLRRNGKEMEIIPVGDVNNPRKIIQAVHEGFHAARRI